MKRSTTARMASCSLGAGGAAGASGPSKLVRRKRPIKTRCFMASSPPVLVVGSGSGPDTRRRDLLDQPAQLRAARGTDAEGVQHVLPERVLERLVDAAAQVALAEQLHADDP